MPFFFSVDSMMKSTVPGSTDRRVLIACLAVVAIVVINTNVWADSVTQSQALRIVNQYAGEFTSPATWPNGNETPDGPLMGNGDLGVVVMGNINALQFVMNKNEFWSLNQGERKAMATLNISLPGMSGASYSMQENLANGQVTGQFATNGNQILTTSWVQADDTVNNWFFTQFTYIGSGTQTVTVSPVVGMNNSNPTRFGTSGSVLFFDVAADNTSSVGGDSTCQVQIALSAVGAASSISNNQLQFTLVPGETVTLATSVMSNYDLSNYQNVSISNVSNLNPPQVDSFNASHTAWWADFWSRSFIEIPDKVLEKEFYGSLYLLASVSRSGETPPGLWGNWIKQDPAFNGDFTLNYNFESPFYAAFATNHAEVANSYDNAVINWIPNAEVQAASNGWTGAFYRVHIGPLPNGSGDTSVHNQKFNGAFAVNVMLQHYYYTRDIDYANAIYPTVKEIATFWQNYLSFDGTHYNILDDAQYEDDRYPETNGVLSLGMVRFLLQGAIDLSTVLEVDAATRSTWQNELNNIAPFPTFVRNGQTIFSVTQVGTQFNGGNSIAIQHIYPGNQIGLGSSSSLVTIAQNTIGQMQRWFDGNGTVTFYPAAARVGYNPATILSNLDNWVNGNTYPNLHIHTGGGGMENLNTVPSAISEMLLQSFQGTIIVFPNWPSGTNAKFGDLLAWNNFLVSSSIVNNNVQYVRITSGSGWPATIRNPWPGQTVQLYRNGSSAGTLSGANLTIPTATDDVLLLAPNGTSSNTITTEMGTPLAVTSESPFGNNGAAIPGTVQAENYDLGGQGVGYSVSSTNGTANSYRSDGVDLEATSDAGGGFDLGWTGGGQWFRYTVNVASAGVYNVSFRVAAPTAVTDGLHLSDSSGTNLSGPVSVPATGGWQTWTTVTATVSLQAGQQVLTLNEDNGGWNINFVSFAEATIPQGPFGGSPANIPGTIQTENYDVGGTGIAYNVTSINGSGNSYRSDGVDLETTSDTGGGFDLGWTSGAQWFRYTVNVASAGTYTVSFRVAAPTAVSDAFHLSDSSGTNLTGPVNVPASGGFQTWTTVTASVILPAGEQTLTLNEDNSGWNINYIAFAALGEGPYGGTPAAIPGTLQAENYDVGGQGTGYSVSSINGTGNSYRADGVNLETTSDTGGGFDLGWTSTGQWFRYTVNVASAGTYTVSFRVAAPSAVTDAFHISNSSGTNLSGSIHLPASGGFQTWATVTATIALPAGQQVLTLNQDNGGWNINYMTFAGLTETPFGGTPAAIPGTVQAENYDVGGQGTAYSVNSVNGTGNSYRSDGVDLETTTDTGGGFDLGWTSAGQWFRYTVNVASAGTYTVSFRVAAPSAVTAAFHLSNSSGTNLSGSINIPATGGWQTWTTVTVTVTLPAGQQVLTLDQDNGGWNINYISYQ